MIKTVIVMFRLECIGRIICFQGRISLFNQLFVFLGQNLVFQVKILQFLSERIMKNLVFEVGIGQNDWVRSKLVKNRYIWSFRLKFFSLKI